MGACGGIRACSGRNGGACGSGTAGDRTLFMKCAVVSLGSVAKSWGSAAVWVVKVGYKVMLKGLSCLVGYLCR